MTDEEIGLNLMMTGNDKSPLPSGWDPCSDSVMNALFRKGCFHHILEDIFYLLEPKTLFNCSLVCRDWNLYLKKLVWCNAQGERRITDNWLHMSPLMKEIPVPLTPEETKQLRQLSDNQESRLQCPMFIVMIDEDLICAVAGRIQVFDKKTGRLKKSLEQKLEIFFWKFSASRDFLIAYQGRGSVCRVYCWDRRKDYRLQVVRGPGLPISELSFINDHMLLGEHVNPSGKKLLGLRLDLDQEQLKFNWCSKTEHHLYSTTGSFIITCRSIPGAGGENDHAAVEILEKETGKKVHELTFDCGVHDSPKGLAYSSPLGIALMCRVDEAAEEGWLSFTVVDSKLFFFDMAHGFVIREIGIDYAK